MHFQLWHLLNACLLALVTGTPDSYKLHPHPNEENYFEMLDGDKDGRITRQELIQKFGDVNQEQLHQINLLFHGFDEDNNGVLHPEEFRSMDTNKMPLLNDDRATWERKAAAFSQKATREGWHRTSLYQRDEEEHSDEAYHEDTPDPAQRQPQQQKQPDIQYKQKRTDLERPPEPFLADGFPSAPHLRALNRPRPVDWIDPVMNESAYFEATKVNDKKEQTEMSDVENGQSEFDDALSYHESEEHLTEEEIQERKEQEEQVRLTAGEGPLNADDQVLASWEVHPDEWFQGVVQHVHDDGIGYQKVCKAPEKRR